MRFALLGGQAAGHEATALARKGLLQPLAAHVREDPRQVAADFLGVPDLPRVHIEAIVQQVGRQHRAIAIHQIGPGRAHAGRIAIAAADI
jgi:hypothetical protein